MAFGWWSCRPDPNQDKRFKHSFIPVDGVQLHVIEHGSPSRPAILYIHGSPGSWDNALSIAIQDQLSDFWFVSYDRPGFGQSHSLNWSGSLDEQAAIAEKVLNLSPYQGPCIVVGHSFGAPIAVRLAIRCPDRVKALVLIGAAIDPDLERIQWFQRLANTKLARALLPQMWDYSNQELLPLKSELTAMSPDWDGIACPITMVHGGRDRLVPPAQVHYARTTDPSGVRQAIFPTRGHFLPWQEPEAIAAIISDM
ncbi:MAG: alpha/beta hydrolase [Acidobacteria bacterium]|nr:alpha/beta hydrolase [Acidobacteriota bacterium]